MVANTSIRTAYGDMIVPKADMFIARSLIEYGEWTHGEITLMEQLIRPGMVALDIGANIGTHSLAMAKLAGAFGRVVALEPQPRMFALLAANAQRNHKHNILPLNMAASDEPGWLDFPDIHYEKSANYGGVSVETMVTDTMASCTNIPIAMCKLDDVAMARKCDFLKMDVEEMELAVLKGARKIIEDRRPLLYIENELAGDRSKALIKLLLKWDYVCYWHIVPLFRSRNFRGNEHNVFGKIACVNMLCVASERQHNISGLKRVADPDDHPRTKNAT